MDDFSDFMKSEQNRVDKTQQHTRDIAGYFYQGADGGQMAFWTHYADRTSEKHVHDFDEYMVCVAGQYTVCMGEKEITLNSGDEILIPKNTEHWGKAVSGTRNIHAFGGKRIFTG